MTRTITRQDVEDFLYREAALLDAWKLDQWLELLTDGARYEVPATDLPSGDSSEVVFLVADDSHRLRSRASLLLGKTAWAEQPHSRTRRLITNVQLQQDASGVVHVTANFLVYRFRNEIVDTYVGHYEHELVQQDDQLRIRKRRAVLDSEALRPQGKLSIIL